MQVVPSAARRTATTPNATMTTLASPSLGGATRSMWIVEMPPGATGPVHAFAEEVIWAVTRGTGEITAGGETAPLGAGDTVVLPGGELRRLTAGPDGFSAVVTTASPGTVTREDGTSAGTPEWVA